MRPLTARRAAAPRAAALVAALLASLVPLAGASAVAHAAPVDTSTGCAHRLTAVRMFDSKAAVGQVGTKAVPARTTISLDVRAAGLAADAAAALLRVTAVKPTAVTTVSLTPGGQAAPTLPDLWATKAKTTGQTVAVAPSSAGVVAMHLGAGPSHLIVDLVGQIDEGCRTPLAPVTLVDTRAATAPAIGSVTPVSFAAAPDAAGAAVVELVVHAINPAKAATITVWPTGQPRPAKPTMTVAAKTSQAAIVPTEKGSDGTVSVAVAGSPTHLVVVARASLPGGAKFTSISPVRVFDTGVVTPPATKPAKLAAKKATRFSLAGLGNAVPSAPGVVLLSVQVPKGAATALTFGPAGTTADLVPQMRVDAAPTTGLVLVEPDASGAFQVFNSKAALDLVISVIGWFPPPPPVNQVNPDVTVVPETDEVESATPRPDGGGSITLDGIEQPDPGDVLAVGITPDTPAGMFGRITTVGANGDGSYTLTTEPTSITDIVPNADLSQSYAVDTPALDPFEIGLDPADPDEAESNAVKAQPRANSCRMSGDATPDGAPLQVTPIFSQSFQPRFSATWTSLSDARVSLGMNASLTAGVQIQASAGLNCDVQQTLYSATGNPITFIGPIPVVPRVSLDFSLKGKARAGVTLDASQTIGLDAGVTYDSGNLSSNFVPTTSSSGDFDADGNANLRAGVALRVSILVGGVAGPYLFAEAYGKVAAASTASPWWTIDGGLDVGAGLELDLVALRLNVEVARYNLFQSEISRATNAYPGPVRPESGSVDMPDARVGTAYDEPIPSIGGRAPLQFEHTKYEMPRGTQLTSDGRLTGTPTQSGIMGPEIRITDADGRVVKVRLYWEIYPADDDPPPPPPDEGTTDPGLYRVSNHDDDGNAAGGEVTAISGDGRYTLFTSQSGNVVLPDTNGVHDVFLHDAETDRTTLVSKSAISNDSASDGSVASAISKDGRWVAFESLGTDLVAGAANDFQSYLWDRSTGTSVLVSRTPTGGTGDNDLFLDYNRVHSISDDGRYTLFDSSAGNLVTGDDNFTTDAFVFDRQTNTVSVVLRDGAHFAESGTRAVAMTPDGRYVLVVTRAILGGDGADTLQLYLVDRQANTRTLVSRKPNAFPGNGDVVDDFNNLATGVRNRVEADLSDDGRFVVFSSDASDLVANDGNGRPDGFLFDRTTNVVTRVSPPLTPLTGAHDSYAHRITPDGRYVLLTSDIRGNTFDSATTRAVFRYDRTTGQHLKMTRNSSEVWSDTDSWAIDISDDGRFVSFGSRSTEMVSGDENGRDGIDVFVSDATTNTIIRLSSTPAAKSGNGASKARVGTMSASGRSIVFQSQATDLLAGDGNAVADVFRYNLAPDS